MKKCVFCEIVKGNIESFKIAENKEFIAILDIKPLVRGQALVIPKKHYSGDPINLPDKVYAKAFLFGKKVSKILQKTLKAKRVFIVVEGMQIDHFHIKLYPVYRINKKVEGKNELIEKFRKYTIQNWYSGYITTLYGPQNIKSLKATHKRIISNFLSKR
jgi:diadenosine tetraphosphate (Ap4A) HIT family hydrolase